MDTSRPPQSRHGVAVIGGLLIIIGLLALIIGSWDSFSPTGRILTAVIPLAILYGLIAIASRREAARPVIRYALITASVSLPLVLGVVLFQSGIFTEVGAPLVTVVALVSAANAGLIEFLYGDALHTPLTLSSLIVAALGLISWLSLDVGGSTTIFLLTGALMIALGVIQSMDPRNRGTAAWHTTGAVLVLGSLAILPFALTKDVADADLHASLTALAYIGSAAITSCLAVLYSRLWQAQKHERYLYDVRSVFENSAALLLIIPAILLAFTSSFGGTFLVLLGAALISIGVSTKVRLSSFRVLGAIGIAATAVRLAALGLRDLAAIWPIVLVGVGLLLFVVAIFSAHQGRDWDQSLFALPATSWEHMGEPFAPLDKKSDKKGVVAHDSTGWFWLILILVVLFALAYL